MKENTIFQNISETQEKDNKKLRQTLCMFLGRQLNIPPGELQEIEIIRPHRLGVTRKYTTNQSERAWQRDNLEMHKEPKRN